MGKSQGRDSKRDGGKKSSRVDSSSSVENRRRPSVPVALGVAAILSLLAAILIDRQRGGDFFTVDRFLNRSSSDAPFGDALEILEVSTVPSDAAPKH